MAELAAAGARAAIKFALDQKAEADAVADHQAGGAPGAQSRIALGDGERHGAGIVLDQHRLAEAPVEASGQREVAGPEHRAPGHDPVAGVHIALAGKADGLDVAGAIVLGEGRDGVGRARPAAPRPRDCAADAPRGGSRGCARRCRPAAVRSGYSRSRRPPRARGRARRTGAPSAARESAPASASPASSLTSMPSSRRLAVRSDTLAELIRDAGRSRPAPADPPAGDNREAAVLPFREG